MAVTADPYTSTDLQYTIPELWPGIIQEAKFPEATISDWVTDLSYLMEEGGDVVNIPDIYTNTFTVQSQSIQGAEITTESVAQANKTLTVDTHKYVAFMIGDKDLKQIASKFKLSEKYADQARRLLMQSLEVALFGLYGSITNTGGDALGAVTDLHIRQAIETLDENSFELDRVALFLHPAIYWNQLLGYSKFYDRSKSGMRPVKTGNFNEDAGHKARKGTVYGGIPVYTSSDVTVATSVSKNLLIHDEAMGFATQTMGGNRVRVQAEYQLRNLGMLTVADMVYGVAVLRADAGVMIEGLNTSTVDA